MGTAVHGAELRGKERQDELREGSKVTWSKEQQRRSSTAMCSAEECRCAEMCKETQAMNGVAQY